MRIAVLSWYAPGGRDSGERVRLAGVVAELAHSHEVDCLFLEPGPDDENSPGEWIDLRSRLRSRPYRILANSIAGASLRGRSVYSELLNRRDIADPIREWLSKQSYDVILANQLYVIPLIPPALHSRVILDTHNADSLRLKRLAREGNADPFKRLAAYAQSVMTRHFESQLAKTLMGVWAVSDADAEHFHSLAFNRVAVVPNGTQVPPQVHQSGRRTNAEIKLLFVGSLGYSANLDALQWFCDEWGSAARDISWRLTVVGSGDISRAQQIIATEPRIALVGRVESVDDYYLTADALVVPMRQGGGTRLKVIEAMAAGLPIISTEMGMEGVGARPGEHYLQVRSPEGFKAALRVIRDSPADVEGIAREALRLSSQFMWPVIRETMEFSLTDWYKPDL